MNRLTSLAAVVVTASAGIAMLGMTSLTAAQDEVVRPKKGQAGVQAVPAPVMTVRGGNDAVVGRRFTLEVIIANPTNQAIKDLEFVAELDANLQLEGKGGSHLEKISSIAGEGVHIVRMALTPTKKGPARVDIVLRVKNGPMQQVQQVMPVFAAEDAPSPPVRPSSAPLAATVTTPKNVHADRPALFLIHVQNRAADATGGTQIVVAYGSLSSGIQVGAGFNPALPINQFDGIERGGLRRPGLVQVNPTNPVRETRVSIPALMPNECHTVPVVLTPRRVGEFRLVITSGNQNIGTASTQANFDPKTSIEDLLPKVTGNFTPRLPRTLAEVTEISLEDRCGKGMKADEAFEHVAHILDKVKYANAKQTDAFVAGLQANRPDLTGVPMAMGDRCRLTAERANQFVGQLSQLRVAMSQSPNGVGLASRLPNAAAQSDEKSSSARIAAMMQVLGPESVHMRKEMVSYLTTISSAESTRALASLAVFSEEEQVRGNAIDALKGRREQDYTEVLARGLNYPWPAVAQNAGDAIVRLKRRDLIPQLVATLERPDPRAPEARDGKLVVREMVKINHLRNCMLCHPPAGAEQLHGGVVQFQNLKKSITAPLIAQVPIPNQALPVSPGNGGGYGSFSVPETLIRFDVTYLRQDFSVMLPVADHQPWPANQRFDFLVRTREISEKDAQIYRDLLRPAGAGALSPYQRAAVSALRCLTGRDAGPTAPAWRELLQKIQTEG